MARHAFMVGSEGAEQVSKPATVPFGVVGGTGAGLLAGTGPVGAGAGAGGAGLAGGDEGGSQPGGTPAVGLVLTGQAGLVSLTMTGCRLIRNESPVRGRAAGWAPLTAGPFWVLLWAASGRTVARIWTAASELVP